MPSSQSGREHIDNEPLRHAPGAITMDVLQFSLDDDDDSYDVDKADRDVYLEEWETDWSTLTLTGTITFEEELSSLFPPEDWADGPSAELVLAVHCDYTHLREGRTIPVDDFEADTIPFAVTLNADAVYGTVKLSPYVVRTTDGEHSEEYRTHAGLEVADGNPWFVHIDETDEGSGPLLPPFFKSFEQSDNDDRFPDDAVYVVDKTELDAPKLYVNRDHEPIASALNTGPRGQLGRVMMVFNDTILLPALSELVLWTADDVNQDGEPEHDWQRDLLAQIGTEMYDVNSATEAGRELYEEADSDGGMPQLLDRTSRGIQQYLELSDDMNNLVNAIR